MSRIRAFRGIHPRPELANEVVAPPYDVLSEDEARQIHQRKPRSFLTVTRPEVNLSRGVDSHGGEAYAAARLALDTLIAQGALVQDPEPGFYLYAQRMGEHRQTALVALCSVDEYDRGLIKKHEFTRPDKEQDRVDHMEACDAQTGMVFLAYRRDEGVQAALAQAEPEPIFAIVAEDGVEHALSRVSDPAQVRAIQAAFDRLPALYVADGHHRSAAASRVNAARGGEGPHNWFVCGIFPDDQLYCMAYNRLVHDLNHHSSEAFRAALGEHFELSPASDPVPAERGTATMYLDGEWTLLRPRPGVVDEGDPVARLDVAVLQDRVLAPLLAITDPRRDSRVSFVGGIRGAGYLADEVDAGRARVAFHLYPTGLDQLFAVADADQVMPPKSTWFEPKLQGGVVIHRLG